MAPVFAQPMPRVRLADLPIAAAFERVLPRSLIHQLLADLGRLECRSRKLPAELVVQLAIGASLFPDKAWERVDAQFVHHLRLLAPTDAPLTASKSAICQARYRLGPRPLVQLTRALGQPRATRATPGAWLWGYRTVALDGTTRAVPDSPANARYFGTPRNEHGSVGFPTLRAMLLVECGTHSVLDAGVWPYATGEIPMATRLLRSVTADMLVLLDRGLCSTRLFQAIRAQGAQVLARVPSGLRLPVEERLSDGSYLSTMTASHLRHPTDANRLRVRVVVYTLTDPNRVGHHERHRLITTLLDPATAPAIDLIVGYHERWEEELVFGEQATRLHHGRTRLRSEKPTGVIQEFYGMLVAHTVIRAAMAEAATEAGLDPRRLSFIVAVDTLQLALVDFQLVSPIEWDRLWARLKADLRRHLLPPRAPRINPRQIRFRRHKFPPRKTRLDHPPQPSGPFRDSVQMLLN